MLAHYEERHFENEIKVWFGEYFDLKNMVHWHKEIEIIYIKKGVLKIGVNSETFYANEGDLIICNSGDIHFCDSDNENTVVDILIFNGDIVKSVNSNLNLISPYIACADLVKYNLNPERLFKLISNELKEKNQLYHEVIKAYLVEFFSKCYRHLECQDISFRIKSRKKNILGAYQLLFEYIDTNYYNIDFSVAADFMHFTPAYFSKIFKSISGTTFTEYINFVRIEKAVEMIKKEDMTINAISIKCGFDNIRNFNRVFKKLTGTTPSEITSDFYMSNFTHPKKKATSNNFNPTIHHSKLIINS